MSNVFYRDLVYGVSEYLAKRNVKIGFTQAEVITHEVIASFEKKNIFRKVNSQGWVVLYPEFTTPKTVVAPAPVPAPAAAAQAPAVAAPAQK